MSIYDNYISYDETLFGDLWYRVFEAGNGGVSYSVCFYGCASFIDYVDSLGWIYYYLWSVSME